MRGLRHSTNALATLALGSAANMGAATHLLVGQLRIGPEQSRAAAAAALWRLARENPEHAHTIASAGDASELVGLLRRGSEGAQAYALWALSLCIDAGNASTILEADGVGTLVAKLTCSEATARAQSAAAIARLSGESTAAQQAIAAEGGISPLISILDGTSATTSMASKHHAAAALAALANVAANSDMILEYGAIPPLVNLLSEGRMERGREPTLRASSRARGRERAPRARTRPAGELTRPYEPSRALRTPALDQPSRDPSAVPARYPPP